MSLPGLLITGTDTNVGKTYVTAMIARDLIEAGRQVGAYKPVCSGGECDATGRLIWADVQELASAIGGKFSIDHICPQRFQAAAAPPVAAELEGKRVDAQLLRTAAHWWRGQVDLLLVEGVGGLLCPLTEDETLADLARDLAMPLLIVARLGLGTVNHTLMTVEVARHRGLKIAGIVLNQPQPGQQDQSCASNPGQIARRCDAPVLGVIEYAQSALIQGGQRIRMNWSRFMEL